MEKDGRRMTCERCGEEFACSRETVDRCWCAAEPYRLPIPAAAGGFSGCLCPSCLRSVAELPRASGSAGSPSEI
ncbi:MAG TPA: cysteine-rich CWC family protein [Bradyrhizobium sp.]|nr:cysteine-rich CWC family protein [Bradyrhizobium sp.]